MGVAMIPYFHSFDNRFGSHRRGAALSRVVFIVAVVSMIAVTAFWVFERGDASCDAAVMHGGAANCAGCHAEDQGVASIDGGHDGGHEAHYSRIRGDGLPPREPNPWFFAERAYPQGRIPREVWRSAQEQAAVLKAEADSRNNAWIPKGPTNVGGRITDMAVDPTDGDTVYAAAAEGGVFRSIDGGQHWTPLFDDQPSLAVGAIAIDPSNVNVIYAGTGEVNPGGGSVAYGGTGIYRSADQGDTWTYDAEGSRMAIASKLRWGLPH